MTKLCRVASKLWSLFLQKSLTFQCNPDLWIEVDCGLKADGGTTSAEAESDPRWLNCSVLLILLTALAKYYTSPHEIASAVHLFGWFE